MTTYLVPTKLGRKILNRLKGKKNIPRLKKKKLMGGNALQKKLNRSYDKNKGKTENSRFQHPDTSTVVIYDEKSTEIFRCKGSVPKKKLNGIIEKYPKATVLIELGNGLFKQVPIRSFKKLIEIKFVTFRREYEFFGIDEFEPESKSGDWFTPEAVVDHIYSINQLIKVFIVEEAFDRSNDTYLSAKFYELAGVDKVCEVLYHSGEVEEIEYSKFLKKYNLNIEMGLFEKKLNTTPSKKKKSKKVEIVKKKKKKGKKKKTGIIIRKRSEKKGKKNKKGKRRNK